MDAATIMPQLPVDHARFIEYVADNQDAPMPNLLQPFQHYEAELRKVFAQQPEHAATSSTSVVPVFAGHEDKVKIRARNIEAESENEKDSYIMPLLPNERKPDGAPAIAQSLQEFKTNLNIFSESSLVDLDWSNVVVAGSAVVTSLLSIPKPHAGSKRNLRRYFHEIVAPASDVDIFLYDLTEAQAVEKIKQIEKNVRDALLVETTTIRTKNTITIASQYPVRHVQIVLRIYKSVSEILTGFDVDCSCAAFDGNQVWASPRALAAYMTQTNTIDLSRRSPSYENRLSKYRHRGFEVKFPGLDRSRIDPTIYERSFFRTEGLARLLILEKLPKSSEREAYIDQRRQERGRPAADRSRMRRRFIRGNIKNKWEDEVAEWDDIDKASSNYHTCSIPYGPKFHARKIEKILFTKDMLLNAEWNKPKDREVKLHRHPAFFGSVEDVIGDCCGDCPPAVTVEEEEVAEQESKSFISGPIGFIKDDPGRQAIGSFNPLSPEQYTGMAYVGNTQMFCQAIVDGDLEYVRQWLEQEGNDPNTRDHTGRCPLHLAVSCSTLGIVQALIEKGARIVARLVDGKTALHIACIRGDVQMASALLRKSEENEEKAADQLEARRKLRSAARSADGQTQASKEESTFDMVDEMDTDTNVDVTTEGSIINIQNLKVDTNETADETDDSPDVYDVNVLAWDTPTSPLHLAVLHGHAELVKCLVQDFGADVLLPVVPTGLYHRDTIPAILTLSLALKLTPQKASEVTRLLFELGASSAQADMTHVTALQSCIAYEPALLNTYTASDPTGVSRAIKNVSASGNSWRVAISAPLLTAIDTRDTETALRLLRAGAKAHVPFEAYLKAVDTHVDKAHFEERVQQPVISAVHAEMPVLTRALVEEFGIDCNTLTPEGYKAAHGVSWYSRWDTQSLLDLVKEKIQKMLSWKPDDENTYLPPPVLEDSVYLSKYEAGSYQYHFAASQVQWAREKRRFGKTSYNHEANPEVGAGEKKEAISAMIDEFRKLEAFLEARSAKTLRELHPNVEVDDSRNNRYGHDRNAEERPFEVKFDFHISIPDEELRERYIRLFEAAWAGDTKAVNELTLTSWQDAVGETRPPLQIAVMDKDGDSPFALAVFRGHLELATAIMKIAQAQYTPPDAPKQRQYHIASDTESDDMDVDEEEDGTGVALSSEIIHDQATIEDIGNVSLLVKSPVDPATMLSWKCPNDIKDREKAAPSEDKRKSSPGDLIELSLARNDLSLLNYILALRNEYPVKSKAKAANEPGDSVRHAVSKSTLSRAFQWSHSHVLAEFLQHTGAGIPLDELAQMSGVEDVAEKPRYYQGLNVRGKKRKAWADAGRYGHRYDGPELQTPPLLLAARHGSLESVEWLLSDAPLRCYKQFASDHQDDKRIQVLSRSECGFDRAVKTFLSDRSHLAIHCCIIGEQTENSLKMLKYLVDVMPDALEAKSSDGFTPLLIAFRLHRIDAAKILIDAGADQTARDKQGLNLLHQILWKAPADEGVAQVRALFDIVDKRLLPEMWTQRCSAHPGALTPLALWVSFAIVKGRQNCEMLRLILEYSEGSELGMFNGEGNTPLHVLVRMGVSSRDPDAPWFPDLAGIMLKYRPDLLNRENAMGRTPLEMVEDARIAYACSKPFATAFEQHATFRYNLGRFAQKYSSITDAPAQAFVQGDRDASSHGRYDHAHYLLEVFRELFDDTMARLSAAGNDKRRLVSLNEASEVVRRLADVQRKQIETVVDDEDMDPVVQKTIQDEVQLWMTSGIVE